MTKTSESRTKTSEPSICEATRAVFPPASHTEALLTRGGFPVAAALELDLKPAWLVAFGMGRLSHRVRQADRLRSSAVPDTGNNFGSQHGAGRCGRSRLAYSRSIA